MIQRDTSVSVEEPLPTFTLRGLLVMVAIILGIGATIGGVVWLVWSISTDSSLLGAYAVAIFGLLMAGLSLLDWYGSRKEAIINNKMKTADRLVRERALASVTDPVLREFMAHRATVALWASLVPREGVHERDIRFTFVEIWLQVGLSRRYIYRFYEEWFISDRTSTETDDTLMDFLHELLPQLQVPSTDLTEVMDSCIRFAMLDGVLDADKRRRLQVIGRTLGLKDDDIEERLSTRALKLVRVA